MSTNLPKRLRAKIYRQAAKSLENGDFTWIQGAFTRGGNTFCAVGAVRETASKLTGSYSISFRALDVERAAVKSVIGQELGLISFNDTKAHTKEQVITVLRRVARALEHGGKL